jgi:Leucine-rich repeat (LRR) protein
VTGGIPKDIYKEGSVLVGLFMPYCSLTGKIPAAADMSIGQFSELSMLNLANNTLTGEIPNYLFADLTNLTHVYLNDNKFTGPLPTNLYDLASAVDISFANNLGINGPLLDKLCP